MKNTFLVTASAVIFTVALMAVFPARAMAHFQLSYTKDMMIERPGDVAMGLIFWHPFENGHVMEMEQPLEFFMIHRGEKTDLSSRLTPDVFQGQSNSATGFRATVPVKRSGDYVVATIPTPYYEESEDLFIQQITKVILNRSTLPTDWDQPVGLPTEILPLNKPYNVITGSTFSGQVLADGKPVAGAEIEIEYIAAEPDLDRFTTTTPSVSTMAGGALVAISDANGVFTFGIPKAGYWGFAALGAGNAHEYQGKELSQDAVIWIHAKDLK